MISSSLLHLMKYDSAVLFIYPVLGENIRDQGEISFSEVRLHYDLLNVFLSSGAQRVD